MPVLPSDFHPPCFLTNGHVQTILPVLLQRRFGISFKHERRELDDGDFLDVYHYCSGRDQVAILSHGLEGSVENDYIRGMSSGLYRAGWDVLAWNYRGCGREPNRLLRLYHSGATGDLRLVIEAAAKRYSRIALVGFSLGGNLTLKYLGEATPHPAVIAGAAISAPVELAASARMLDRKFINRIYLRRFLTTLVAKIEAKALRFPDEIDAVGANKIRSFQEFDDRYTAPLHGFRDATDYWTQSSARQFLGRINVPTLLLNACNDPFLAPECFPFSEAEASSTFYLEAPASGGHVGFLDLKNGLERYSERRVVEFLREHAA